MRKWFSMFALLLMVALMFAGAGWGKDAATNVFAADQIVIGAGPPGQGQTMEKTDFAFYVLPSPSVYCDLTIGTIIAGIVDPFGMFRSTANLYVATNRYGAYATILGRSARDHIRL